MYTPAAAAHGPLTFIACVELRGWDSCLRNVQRRPSRNLPQDLSDTPLFELGEPCGLHTHKRRAKKKWIICRRAVRFEWVERIPLTPRQNRSRSPSVPPSRGSHALMQSPFDPKTCYILLEILQRKLTFITTTLLGFPTLIRDTTSTQHSQRQNISLLRNQNKIRLIM